MTPTLRYIRTGPTCSLALKSLPLGREAHGTRCLHMREISCREFRILAIRSIGTYTTVHVFLCMSFRAIRCLLRFFVHRLCFKAGYYSIWSNYKLCTKGEQCFCDYQQAFLANPFVTFLLNCKLRKDDTAMSEQQYSSWILQVN